MLRSQQVKSFGSGAELSAKHKTALQVLLGFISNNIKGFSNYYHATNDKPKGEEAINTYLVRYFTSKQLEEKDGLLSFSFEKHPATEGDSSEPDFGVSVANSSKPESILFEIEAKRLGEGHETNYQYVYGQNRGAIERFKQGRHGRNINECGIVGYVQSPNCLRWIDKVNGWIDGEIVSPHDKSLKWEKSDKFKTTQYDPNDTFAFGISNSSRIDSSFIKIHHFLINLTFLE
jgi:hypothetical protein